MYTSLKYRYTCTENKNKNLKKENASIGTSKVTGILQTYVTSIHDVVDYRR